MKEESRKKEEKCVKIFSSFASCFCVTGEPAAIGDAAAALLLPRGLVMSAVAAAVAAPFDFSPNTNMFFQTTGGREGDAGREGDDGQEGAGVKQGEGRRPPSVLPIIC